MKKLRSALKRIIKKSVLYVIYKRFQSDYYNSAGRIIKSHYDSKTPAEKKRIEKSLKRCYVYGGVPYTDYWRMHFEELSLFDKMQFVPRCAQMNLYRQVNPNKKYGILLENKGECYQLFQRFYKRDLVSVSKSDMDLGLALGRVEDFSKTHSRFIVKPMWGNCGKGVMICNSTSFDKDSFLSLYPKGFVLEELIKQDVTMSSLHPSSVNTIRIITVNYGNEIEVKWPFLRVGRGDSIVDNAGAGGIILPIDVHSGLTIAAGDESRGLYKTHPDTGIPLVGFQIPEWGDLCNVVREMAASCPDCHIMGWDMAFSDRGWVVVECNYGPDLVFQYVIGGAKKEFVKVRRKLHAKKYSNLIK